jgi:Flp pilus assembly protein TadD
MMQARAALRIVAALAGLTAAMAQAQDVPLCHGASSAAVNAAQATLERDPAVLNARLKLADALIEAECYSDAVRVLEAGEALHPDNPTLEARVRSARSMISEQNYIESVTRAEESARLQRNLLRCRKLGDVDACDEALSVRKNDAELLAARAAALAQQGRSAEPVAAVPSQAAPPATQPTVLAAAAPRAKSVVYSNDAPASRSN